MTCGKYVCQGFGIIVFEKHLNRYKQHFIRSLTLKLYEHESEHVEMFDISTFHRFR